MKKLLFILLFILSCSDGPQSIVFPPGSVRPVVARIILTDEAGNELGIWGSPYYSKSYFDNSYAFSREDSGISIVVPEVTRIRNPYPNPSVGSITLRYDLAKTSKLSILLVKARGSNELEQNIADIIGNAGYLVSNASKILYEGKKPAGFYAMTFSIPEPGFYRVYFQIDDYYLWADILNLPDIESRNSFFDNLFN